MMKTAMDAAHKASKEMADMHGKMDPQMMADSKGNSAPPVLPKLKKGKRKGA